MKKLAIVVIALALLVVGMAAADRGVDPTFETQGIATSVSVNAIGNFESHTNIQWSSVDGNPGVFPVPPLVGTEAYYVSSFVADTLSLGTGFVAFDRTTDVETSAAVLNQYNIESTQALGYFGIDGGRVTSEEDIMVDGAALPVATAAQVPCPFAANAAPLFPAYCNRATAGSSIDMTVASVITSSNDRFVMSNTNFPVELNSDIRVTEFADVPSIGMAEGHMEVLIQEARSGVGANGGNPFLQSERITMSENTVVDGEITLFERLQHYESGPVR